MLAASICKVASKRPFFILAKSPVRLTVKSLSPEQDVRRCMETSFESSFGDGSGALARATLFHGTDCCLFVLAAHHSALDGKTSLLIIEDLLTLLDGGELGPAPVWQSLDAQANPSNRDGYIRTLPPNALPEEAVPSLAPPRFFYGKLNANETSALAHRAKAENASVHGALMAAMALAGARHSTEWRTTPVTSFTVVDARQAYGSPTDTGVLITAALSTPAPVDDLPFWDRSRKLRDELLPQRSKDGIAQAVSAVDAFVGDENTPADYLRKMRGGPLGIIKLVVSNYAGYPVRTDYKNFTLIDVVPSLLPTNPATQLVTAITVRGQMQFVQASREPILRLLEDTREILLEACRA